MQIDIQTPIDEEHTKVQYAVYTVPVSQFRNYVTKVLLRMLELNNCAKFLVMTLRLPKPSLCECWEAITYCTKNGL